MKYETKQEGMQKYKLKMGILHQQNRTGKVTVCQIRCTSKPLQDYLEVRSHPHPHPSNTNAATNKAKKNTALSDGKVTLFWMVEVLPELMKTVVKE